MHYNISAEICVHICISNMSKVTFQTSWLVVPEIDTGIHKYADTFNYHMLVSPYCLPQTLFYNLKKIVFALPSSLSSHRE